MTGLKRCIMLLAAALLAACASAPEQATEPVSAAEPAGGAAHAAPATASRVVDLNAAVDDPDSTVICREMLRPASNVIDRLCMTRADWDKYRRAEARYAQEQLRIMQGGAFR